MDTAVLVIDVQQALCSGRWAMHDTAAMITRINALLRRARAAGVPVLMIQHEEPDSEMAHGSPGWQLAEGLDVQPGDQRLRKTASGSFHQTPLQALLQSLGARQLVVCGLQTEFCIDTTVRQALALGYPVTLVADGHSTMDNGVLGADQIRQHHNLTLSHLDSFGPRVSPVPAAEVVFGG